jgi:urea transporter
MTDNERTIRTVAFAGYLFDRTDGPSKALIQPNAVAGVCVCIAALAGARTSAFTVDSADIDSLSSAVRTAALEAGEKLDETMCGMEASYAIERIYTT